MACPHLWSLGVVDVNRVAPAGHSKDGSMVEELAEVLGVQGGRGDEQLEVGPEASQILDKAKQDVRVKRPFVSLIDHHHTTRQKT